MCVARYIQRLDALLDDLAEGTNSCWKSSEGTDFRLAIHGNFPKCTTIGSPYSVSDYNVGPLIVFLHFGNHHLDQLSHDAGCADRHVDNVITMQRYARGFLVRLRMWRQAGSPESGKIHQLTIISSCEVQAN